MLKWNRENTLKKVLPNKSGIYQFYDKNRRVIYVGHAHNLRHRVESYREQDDFNTHPTKKLLRPHIKYYSYREMPIKAAEAHERMLKKGLPYNFL